MYLFFLVLSVVNYLPRYKYHIYLLQFFLEGLPLILETVLSSSEENLMRKVHVFGDALPETVPVKNSPKGY